MRPPCNLFRLLSRISFMKTLFFVLLCIILSDWCLILKIFDINIIEMFMNLYVGHCDSHLLKENARAVVG